MISVSAHDLVVTKGDYPAVAAASFELPKKFCCVVTGANGSGKTTLLKAISGITQPTRGEVVFTYGSETVTTSRLMRRIATYVGHTPLFMRHITVGEHFRLCAQFDAGKRKEDFVESIEHVLHVFRLDNKKNVEVQHLSAGQQRRLHLASALIRTTPLLCIDEPHSSLDADSKQLIDSILEDQKNKGRNLIVATHDPERLSRIATHTMEILNGTTQVAHI